MTIEELVRNTLGDLILTNLRSSVEIAELKAELLSRPPVPDPPPDPLSDPPA